MEKNNTKEENIIGKLRYYGDWVTYGMLGLGAILTANPATMPLGVSMIGGSALDKASDVSIGQEIENIYVDTRNKFHSQKSGKRFAFPFSKKPTTLYKKAL